MNDFAVPDTYALRRRVLLAGVVTFAAFLAVAWLLFQLRVSDAWLLISMVPLYLFVMRPLMKPVREAIALRRRLAYDSWLDDRDDDPEGRR